MHQLLTPPTNHIVFRKKVAEMKKVPIKFSQTYRDNAQIKIKIKKVGSSGESVGKYEAISRFLNRSNQCNILF